MISDLEARRISSLWHGGGGSALYALSSTGAIDTARADHDIFREIWDALPETFQADHELYQLQKYVHDHGPRGPVDGWSTLTW